MQRHASRYLPSFVKDGLRRLLKPAAASHDYHLLSAQSVGEAEGRLRDSWKAPAIVQSQRDIVDGELARMYAGEPPQIYAALTDAVRATGEEHGAIVEVGCASGYYCEVLRHMLGHPISYSGIDYSPALVEAASRYYPDVHFQVGDAASLPLNDGSCDVLISGCVLLHVPEYAKAIAESARVARRWVIFHRTPVVFGATAHFKKTGYGIEMVETAFGQSELGRLFNERP